MLWYLIYQSKTNDRNTKKKKIIQQLTLRLRARPTHLGLGPAQPAALSSSSPGRKQLGGGLGARRRATATPRRLQATPCLISSPNDRPGPSLPFPSMCGSSPRLCAVDSHTAEAHTGAPPPRP